MKKSINYFARSLRARLFIGSFVWIFFVVLATGWVLTDLFEDYSQRQLASELKVQMNQLLAAFDINDQHDVELEFDLNDARFARPLSGLYWQIDEIKDNGEYVVGVLRSRSLWDQDLVIPKESSNEDSLLEITGPKETTLFASIKDIKPVESDSDYRLVIAIDKDILAPVTTRFNLMVAIFLGLLALTMVIALSVQVWLSLKSMVLLRQNLEDVLGGGSKKVNGKFPSEVQPLVDAFNKVLQANENIVEQARAEAGNLAHALKTPLSIISNSVSKSDGEQAKLIQDQVQSARHYVDYHLTKARAIAIGATQSKQVAVRPIVAGLERTLQRLYIDKKIELHSNQIASDWLFIGEANDLQEMLGNLIENAYKWAKHNIWLDIKFNVDKSGSSLVIIVEDDGHGLSSTEQSMLFKRGVRLDERTPGSGLGLAIVSDLANAYGGSVSASSSIHGGLKIILVLPATLLTNQQ